MKKKIIIRCDGAAISKIGTGHVVRAIALAKVLIKQKICLSEEIIFVTQRQGLFKIGYNLIKDAGFYIEPNKKNNLKWNSVSEASFLSNLHADILILDRLSTSHKFMLTLKKKFKYLVSFDDTGSGSRVADVVINGILHKLPKRDSLYQGYKYLFLNNINHKKKKISKKVKNVAVSFGGHDERNLLGFYLDILRKNKLFDNKKFKIDLLVGNKDDVNLRYWKKTN
jgi:spore coat polysaccharide biosynthesis predicted glycosyltransferase SpsG